MMNAELSKNIAAVDWEFAEIDTQYMTHNIHRYSGKFIPQIAGKAIELLTQANDTVLDSYSGSGTTLLEAMLRGHNSIGVDLNPLAILISKVKTTRVNDEGMEEIHSLLIPYVSRLLSAGQLSLLDQQQDMSLCDEQVEKNTWRLEDTWNQKWYQQDVLVQLVQIYSCIELITSEKAKNISLVAFSDILRKSSNASSKYPNVMFDKNVKKKPLPARAFMESLNHVMGAVKAMTSSTATINATVEIFLNNNLSMPLPDSCVDAIITHPPYIAAIPYAEYGSLSLNWFGFDSKQLDSEMTGGKRHSSRVVSNFKNDYERYFQESYRVLKPEHYMFLMVGNPVSHGEKIDLCEMTLEYSHKVGLKHITTAIRQGQNRRGNKMGEEYLIFLQK
jgi:methylase of polypeptide subunit release factors